MRIGCARDNSCTMWKNDGIGCGIKNIVYSATCTDCTTQNGSITEGTEPGHRLPVYIGESSRQVGTRVMEHLSNMNNFKKNSFIIEHWMTAHGLCTSTPKFKFKVLSNHTDPLGRQVREAIQIKQVGSLNRKDEFQINDLSDLSQQDIHRRRKRVAKKLL